MSAGMSFARAVEVAARQMHAPRDLDSTCETVVLSAQRTLPDIDHVSLTLTHRDRTLTTVAATDDTARELDEIQYASDEGPALLAANDAERTLVSRDLRAEQRWPAYVAKALALGVRSQIGLRLHIDDETLGCLNLYSRRPADDVDDVLDVAELFATTAALALGGVRERDHLVAALQSRQQIGTATGIVMERYSLDHQRAFDYLTRLSQQSNVKLRDLAQQMVEEVNRRGA